MSSSPPAAKRARPDTSPPKPVVTPSVAADHHQVGPRHVDKLVLYSYWRSSCSWRVRFALAVKKIPFRYEPVNLIADGGQQHAQEYVDKNPMRQVPTLMIGDKPLSQSLAILEFLEETYPEPKLLPTSHSTHHCHALFHPVTHLVGLLIVERAIVRRLCLIIVADIQPVQNLRVLKNVAELVDQTTSKKWATDVINNGFIAFEKEISQTAGKYCVGDTLTMADICLVPQVYNANRYEVNMAQFPTIQRVYQQLQSLSEYKISHPESQPDCPDKQ